MNLDIQLKGAPENDTPHYKKALTYSDGKQ